MPPQPIYDPSAIDTSKVAVSREDVYKVNPHAFEFQMLDGIYFIDYEKVILAGYRDVRADEFWVRGHIPGRPIFPGVLMIETAAQLVGYYAGKLHPERGFLGFAGVEDVRFRGQVVPGDKVIMIGQMVEIRSRRCVGETQGFVDGRQVYQGIIKGMWI